MIGQFTEILNVVATGFIFMMHGRRLLMVTGSYKYGSCIQVGILHLLTHLVPPFFFLLGMAVGS